MKKVSGIVGIVNLNGAPVDPRLLQRMTDFLAFRGPDAKATWMDGNVGFGHTLLRTGPAQEGDTQPTSLDEHLWIVADSRLDARPELAAKLRAAGRRLSADPPDAELLLHAHSEWGARCVEHLLGDFSFAIWDNSSRRLFCARDHFGFRPFYYARTADSFLFSNTLDCLRTCPGVSDGLNDLAIADFLLYDYYLDLSTTVFADIQRLPPAHFLTLKGANLAVRRYWRLPEAQLLRYRNSSDYVEHFREVFDAAVGDRLRSNAACVALSGGLDSPTVAATARRVLAQRNGPSDLWAFTMVYRSLVPHEEEYFAKLVAKTLGIETKSLIADEVRLYGDFEQPDYRTPQPIHAPMGFSGVNPSPEIANRGRVALAGFGADPLVGTLRSGHVRRMLKARCYWQLAKDFAGYLSAEGRFSRLYVRAGLRAWANRNKAEDSHPEWLNPELVDRLKLRDRREELRSSVPLNQSARPEAYAAMEDPMWVTYLEEADSSFTHMPVEIRHPFFDLRVVNFLLALPGLPWCADKEILRQAGRGILPDAVRLRRKSPMPADPIHAALQNPASQWVDNQSWNSLLLRYVIPERIPNLWRAKDPWKTWVHLKPTSLNFWLKGLRR